MDECHVLECLEEDGDDCFELQRQKNDSWYEEKESEVESEYDGGRDGEERFEFIWPMCPVLCRECGRDADLRTDHGDGHPSHSMFWF